MPFNFPENSLKIRSRKTGQSYEFVCAGVAQLGQTAVTEIAKVCEEPEIYDNVFSQIFKGKRYSEDNARTFIKLISEGWNKTRFDWLILSEGAVVGTIGIKSLDGEIGYWQSHKHPGVVTAALLSLCSLAKEAGLPSLWAHVKKSNVASIKVLEGAGFILDRKLTEKRDDVFGYRIQLN